MFGSVRAVPHIEIEKENNPASLHVQLLGNLAAPGERRSCRVRVKTGNALTEQMFSGLAPEADISGAQRHWRLVPCADQRNLAINESDVRE